MNAITYVSFCLALTVCTIIGLKTGEYLHKKLKDKRKYKSEQRRKR